MNDIKIENVKKEFINDIFEDYGWQTPKTDAHNYLLKTLEKIFFDLNLPKSSKILDAGCGGGYLLSTFYKDMEYRDIWGIDASTSGINIAKQHFDEIQDHFEVHDAYNNKLPNSFHQQYDIVLSIEVLEHMYSPKMYLKNINKWLNKGGYLILSTPYHGYLKNLVVALLNKFDNHVNPLWEGGHVKFFSRNKLSELLLQTGFKISHFYGSGRFPYLWKSMLVIAQKQ